jgi:hypothetical protein
MLLTLCENMNRFSNFHHKLASVRGALNSSKHAFATHIKQHMAATQLLTRASTHSTRAFAPQLIASSKGFSSASSASPARSHQTSHLLQSQRLGRHSVATSAIPSWVPFIGKQRKQVSLQSGCRLQLGESA